MTEHTVTVEKTVEEDETVYTCDYCGLSPDAGEMVHYSADGTDGEGPALFSTDDNDEFPDTHFHVHCIPEIVSNEDEAELTLKEQYERRTGDSLLLVVTGASLLYLAPAAAAVWWGQVGAGLWRTVAAVSGYALVVFFLALSRIEAKRTLQEFTP